MSSINEVKVAFEHWIDRQFTATTPLPDGFEYAVDVDPELLIVTDGVDDFLIEFDVLVIRQPREVEDDE